MDIKKRLLSLSTKQFDELLHLSDKDVEEISRLLNLSREEVEKRLRILVALQGSGSSALLMHESRRTVDGMTLMWASLIASMGSQIDSIIKGAWSRGDTFARDFMRRLGVQIPAVDASGAEWLAGQSIDLASGVTNSLAQRIKGEVMRGIFEGEDISQITNRIIGSGLTSKGTPFRTARARAAAIARTESSRAYHGALQQSLKDVDEVIGYQWSTVFEPPWPCSICRPRHGRFYPKGSVPPIPAHTNCRCFLIPVTRRYGKYDI